MPSDYALTSADLVAYTNIVGMQCDVGAHTLTKAGLSDFAKRLSWSTWNYQTIVNTNLQQQLTLLYQGLANTTTNWGSTVPALLLAYQWAQFLSNDADFRTYYNETGSGITWQNRCAYGNICCSLPSAPQVWHDAVQAVPTTAPSSANPPSTIIWFPASSDEAWTYRASIIAYELDLFDPTKWTDAGLVAQHTTALWTWQSADLANLSSTTPLTDQMCLYLLYLLVGLCTSPNPADLNRVNTLANMDTNSIEYPNDTFIDQLTYYALMAWVDPKGPYQWTHDKLASNLTALAALPNQDPGSVLLQRTFTQQLAVLNSSPSYPMLDPYNPAIGFPQRKTDTLAALAQAWAGQTSG